MPNPSPTALTPPYGHPSPKIGGGARGKPAPLCRHPSPRIGGGGGGEGHFLNRDAYCGV